MPVHKRYYEIIEECKKIAEAKNKDYTGNKDPLYNLKYIENFGIPSWAGILARITDKWTRFETLVKNNDVAIKDENIEDTIKDMINYLIFFLVEYESK
jgi:hypothetical protein